jgi:Ca2+-binding RTX toxin-like protein
MVTVSQCEGAASAPDVEGFAMALIEGDNTSNTLNGTASRDIIRGFGGNDILRGFGGNDDLIGGLGADRMFGGLGNDLFQVDSVSDRVFESANQGRDTVRSSVSYTLGANLENLTLVGAALNGTGNGLANAIIGNGNENTLLGGGGNDILSGGAEDDHLFGGSGNDRLSGGADNDDLTGGAGADVLTGGAGADDFQFFFTSESTPALRDMITDFRRAQGDQIDVSAIDANTGAAGNQEFTFGGSDATPETGELSLLFSGGQVFLVANTDADAAIEFRVRVFGDIPNRALDFDL